MWLSLIGIVLFSIIIFYQDFKERLISLWAVIGFITCSFINYLVQYSIYQFLENAFICLIYFVVCYLILTLYFYLKTKKIEKLLDTKIGWGDVLVLFSIGCTMPFPEMIYFFTISFVLSLIGSFVTNKKDPSIPLAGVSVVLYAFYILFNEMVIYFN